MSGGDAVPTVDERIAELRDEIRQTTTTLITVAALEGAGALFIFTRLMPAAAGWSMHLSTSGWLVALSGPGFALAAVVALSGILDSAASARDLAKLMRFAESRNSRLQTSVIVTMLSIVVVSLAVATVIV